MQTIVNGTDKFIYNILDEYTGENVTYKKVTTWWDGSAMDDGKCDGVIFRKSGTEYFKRVLVNNTINAAWFGLKADGVTDNGPLFATMMNALPNSSNIPIKIIFTRADGAYLFNQTTIINTKGVAIDVNSKNVQLVGDGSGVAFIVPAGVIGLYIRGNVNGWRPLIKNITLAATGKNANDGHIGFNSANAQSTDANDYYYHAIYCEVIADFENIGIESFSGHGFRIYASVADPTPTNASNCRITGLKISNCNGAGIYISGPDANQCVFTNVDVRDCGLCGIFDASFLGNAFFGAMAHNNGNFSNFGHYRVTNVNARSVFIGCYGEGGSPRSESLSNNAIYVGGINESGLKGSWSALLDGAWNKVSIKPNNAAAIGSNSGISLYGDDTLNKTILAFTNQDGGSSLKLENPDTTWVHWTQQMGNADYDIWHFGGPNAILKCNNTLRGLRYSSHGFKRLYVGKKHFTSAPTKNPADYTANGWLKGDIIYNENYNGTNPEGWICTTPGVAGSTIGAYAEGRTISGDGTLYWGLNAQSNVLLPGDTITVLGTTGTVQDIQIFGGNYFLLMDVALVNTGGVHYPITYATPKFKAFGKALGTTAQRPVLDADDAGFQYRDTTINSLIEWTGTAWRILEDVPVNLVDGATINTDVSLGKEFRVTLGGNRTMAAPTNPRNGQAIRYRIQQDATGNRLINWNTIFRFSDTMATALSTDPFYIDYFDFVYNDTDNVWDCLRIVPGFAPPLAL